MNSMHSMNCSDLRHMTLQDICSYVPLYALPYTAKKKLLLCDRDGVLNEDTHFPHLKQDLRILPGAAEALRMFRAAGYNIAVVSNQGGIGMGLYPEADFFTFNEELCRLLAQEGAYLDRIYWCPHPEGQTDCICRKPKPGMILRAMADFGVREEDVLLAGDRFSDVQAASSAHVQGYLLRSGWWRDEKGNPEDWPAADSLRDLAALKAYAGNDKID